MRLPIVVAAGIAVLAAAALPARAGDTRRPRRDSEPPSRSHLRRQAQKAPRRPPGLWPQPTACTQFGCKPIPPGCRIRTGFNPFTWDPSGFDEVVYPYR